MAKRNWSSTEANNDRKPHAAHLVQRSESTVQPCATSVDMARVQAAFASKSDPERTNYTPVIVGRRIVK